MYTDYVENGQGFGEVGEQLGAVRFEPNLLRPYFDSKGRRCITVNTGRKKFDEKLGHPVPEQKQMLVSEAVERGIIPIANAQTTLRKEEWLMMDRAVLAASRQRLRAWNDIPSSFGGFDGMSKMVLEHERMTDVGEAVVDMDGVAMGKTDTPRFQLEGLPLPITHVSFTYTARRLAVARQSGTPLDTTMAEMAGRRVAETIEKTLIGETTGMTYGDAAGSGRGYANEPTVRGYTNQPDRITKTDLTAPTGSNPDTTLAEVLAMRDLATAQNFFGPYMLYHSNNWDQYMDNDYLVGTAAQGLAAPETTLRNRLRAIDGITDVRRLDYWTATSALLLVQMTSDVVRQVNGMGITTVQWPTKGGSELNFRVMAIMVPQIRSQFIGTDQTEAAAKCGIVHATTA